MSNPLWSKTNNTNETPKRYILVMCRRTTSEENLILAKRFKNILAYHSELNSDRYDLSTMEFDLMIIDISEKANHVFLEVISNQAKGLNIPIILLKKSMTNYDAVVDALEAIVIKTIEDFDKKDFLLFLTKNKIPKLNGRFIHCLKGLVSLLLNSSKASTT